MNHTPFNGELTIIVHQKDWQLKHTGFFAQKLAIVNHDNYQRLVPKIAPLESDTYSVTFKNLNKDQILIIKDTNGLYSIALSEISQTLITLFSNSDAPAYAVLANVKDALKSFPNNSELQALLPVWEHKAAEQKLSQAWDKVLEQRAVFLQAKDSESKVVYANNLERDITYVTSLGATSSQKKQIVKMQLAIDEFRKQRLIANQEIEIPAASDVNGNVTRYRASGEHGELTITMVNIGAEGDVLMRFHGLPNNANDVVYRHRKAVQNSATGSYIFKSSEINGDNWNTFNVENDGWGGKNSYVYPPKVNQRYSIYLDNSSTNGAIEDSSQLYKDYVSRLEAR